MTGPSAANRLHRNVGALMNAESGKLKGRFPILNRARQRGELVACVRAGAWRKACSRQTEPQRAEQMRGLSDQCGRSTCSYLSVGEVMRSTGFPPTFCIG